jgi:hypothetical protein
MQKIVVNMANTNLGVISPKLNSIYTFLITIIKKNNKNREKCPFMHCMLHVQKDSLYLVKLGIIEDMMIMIMYILYIYIYIYKAH